MTRYLGFVTPDSNYSPASLSSLLNIHAATPLGTDDELLTGVPREDSISFGGCLIEAGGLDVLSTLSDRTLEIGVDHATQITIGNSTNQTIFESPNILAQRIFASQGLRLGFTALAPEGSIRYNSGSKVIQFFNGTIWQTLKVGKVFPFSYHDTAEVSYLEEASTTSSVSLSPALFHTENSYAQELFELIKES